MDQHGRENIFTVVIGGAAGDGIREAGMNLGKVLAKMGYEVFASFKYPSLIRGGHNFSRVSFSKEKIFYDHSHIDALIAFNDESIHRHLNNLTKDAVVFAENFEEHDIAALGAKAAPLPFAEFIKQTGAPAITKSSAALGAICYLLDIPLEHMLEVLNQVFKEKAWESNITLAKLGYEHLEKTGLKHWKKIEPRLAEAPAEQANKEIKEFIDGNTAFAKGLVAAGLNLYFSYPMTPSTTILHFLARQQKEFGIKVIQPENEIAVIHMALGAAYAGKRAAIGTATGGFALMQEAFSLAGMAEIPIVIAVSQRQAPATGAPTHTSQADLRFVLHSGHGEFPRIVLAPGDPEETFRCGADALNLAWKYQMPVIVLLDKHVSENSTTSIFDAASVKIERGRIVEKIDGQYGRYSFSTDGISPLVFPGTQGVVVKSNSYEHDEDGIATEDLDTIKKMQDKRFTKGDTLMKEINGYEVVKIYGDTKAKNAIVFWGSTKTAVLEAAKFIKKPARLIQTLWLEPFPSEKVARALDGAKNIINIEGNHNAQFAGLLREKTGIVATQKILQYDSRPFDPIELAEKINELL
jgi:2-oxoglutarate ferredoxin oxidoreductase subunit alpha